MGDGHEIADRSIAHAGPWPRSLRGQLLLVPTAVLLVGLLVVVGTILLGARARIAAEISSGMELGDDLVTTALRNVANDGNAAAAFEHLSQSLPRVRHVQFTLVPLDATRSHTAELQDLATTWQPGPWLVRLLAPPPVERVFSVVVREKVSGEVRMRSHAADEIQEIVGEVALFSFVLIVLCLLIVAVLRWTVLRSLRWVRLLADGFDRLEGGDYRLIAPIPLTELQRVGEQFNHLAHSLHRVTADNHLLIDRLISMQERERKELAAELHDEFGPALFGIRAEAASIMRTAALSDTRDEEIRARARSIADLTDGIQKLNYRMLDRLRPLVLEQMGLCQAIRQLVASWQDRYPNIAWLLMIEADFTEPDEATSLTLYRVAQECATNVIRHADASEVTIRLRRTAEKRKADANTRSPVLLSVQDNGKGLVRNVQYGFGLLGMAERVRQVNGLLRVGNGHPNGVVIEVVIPNQNWPVTMERAHANPAD